MRCFVYAMFVLFPYLLTYQTHLTNKFLLLNERHFSNKKFVLK